MNTPFLVQKPSLIARVLFSLTTVALVIVGFFFLTVALVVGALIALVIGVRLWWMIRKIKRAQADTHGTTGASGHADRNVVDGEFQVVERESIVPPPLPPVAPEAREHNPSDPSTPRDKYS